METKQDRFVRIAEARTNKIIDMIRLLGNCSSKSTYEYTKDDVKKIFAAIERAYGLLYRSQIERKDNLGQLRYSVKKNN